MINRPNPFVDLPEGQENNLRLLLERVYWGLLAEMEKDGIAYKAKLGEQEGKIKKLEASTTALCVCPCGKRHDPGSPCPLYLLENEVYRNKWRNTGIKIGLFLAGGIVYHLAQLAMSWMKLPVSP